MRIAELSRNSGVSVPTIKYYLREGLLQAGTRTGPNQASYDDDHLHRLRLIRALSDVGNLPIATIREVVEAIGNPRLSLHEVLGTAHRALGPDVEDQDSEEMRAAREDVDEFISELGWSVGSGSPARRELAYSLVTLRRLGWDVDAHVFERYARVADRLAAWELKQTPTTRVREETVEAAVVGTVVFESVLVALRRLAQENHSARRFAANRTRRPDI
jgi:DNA-binding transcriptional MerR regulator